MAALGVCLALRTAQTTGIGQHVDIAMYDVMVALNEQSVGHYSHFGVVPKRGLSPTSAPYGAFKAKDGWFTIGVASDWIWARFCSAIERPDLVSAAGLRTGMERSANQDSVLRPLIEGWATDRLAKDAASVLTDAGVPAAPVQSVADLFQDPHVAAREMLTRLDDPVVGRLTVAGNPVKLGAHPHIPARTAPQLGADQYLIEELRAARASRT